MINETFVFSLDYIQAKSLTLRWILITTEDEFNKICAIFDRISIKIHSKIESYPSMIWIDSINEHWQVPRIIQFGTREAHAIIEKAIEKAKIPKMPEEW